jgi:hypothetical protein
MIDPDVGVRAFWKPLDARHFHLLTAAARKPFGTTGLQQTLKS